MEISKRFAKVWENLESQYHKPWGRIIFHQNSYLIRGTFLNSLKLFRTLPSLQRTFHQSLLTNGVNCKKWCLLRLWTIIVLPTVTFILYSMWIWYQAATRWEVNNGWALLYCSYSRPDVGKCHILGINRLF